MLRNITERLGDPGVSALVARIGSLSPQERRVTPFPPEWELRPWTMLDLLILGIIGMDGFRYAFVEYAKDCRQRVLANGR